MTAPQRAHDIIDRFLRDAGRQGERDVARIRLLASLLFCSLAILLQLDPFLAGKPDVLGPIAASAIAGAYGVGG